MTLPPQHLNALAAGDALEAGVVALTDDGPPMPGTWNAWVDAAGRLRRLVAPDGATVEAGPAVAAGTPLGEVLLRLEAGAAAVTVADADGVFLGLVTRDSLRAALLDAERAGIWEALVAVAEGVPMVAGEDFFLVLVRRLGSVLGVRWAFVGRLVAEDRVQVVAAVDRGEPMPPFTYRLAGTPCEQALQGGPCLYPAGVARRFPDDRALAEMGVEGYLGVPLRGGSGRTLGILVALHDRPLAESLPAEALLGIFAARAAAELDRLERERTLERHLAMQRVLDGLLARAGEGGSLEAYLEEALATILGQRWLGVEGRGAIVVRRGRELVRVAERGLPPGPREGCLRVPLGVCVCGRVAERGEPYSSATACDDPHHDRRWEGMEEHGHIAVPLRHGSGVLGLMILYVPPGTVADDATTTFLAALGDLLGEVIARRRDLEAMRRLSVAVEQSPAAVVITDREGTIEYVNPRFCELAGYEAGELVGRNPRLLKSGQQGPEVYEGLWRTITAGGVWRGELCNRRRDGSFYWVEAHIAPVTDETGAVRHFIGMQTDISAEREARERAESQRELLEAVTANIDEGILVFDAERRVVWHNRRYCEHWGLDEAFLNSRPTLEELARELGRVGAYPEDRIEAIIADRHRRMDDGEAVRLEAPRIDGRHSELYLHPLPNGGYLIASHDVTERVRAAEALRRRLVLEEVLAEVAQLLLAAEPDLDEVAARLGRATGVEHVFLYLGGPASGGGFTQRVAAAWDAPGCSPLRERLTEIPPQGYPWSQALLVAGEAVHMRRGALPAEAQKEAALLERLGLGSVLVLPVRCPAGGVRGFIGFAEADTERCWADEDLRALRVAAEMLASYFERRRAEVRLRESEERYALAARGANDGLWDWDLEAGTVYYSPRWAEILGYGEEELAAVPESWRKHIYEEDRAAFEQRLRDHLEGRSGHFSCEFRIRRRDGSLRWVLARGLAVRDDEGRAVRIAGSMSDVTERREAQEQVLRDAFYDGPTGLPNRALFEDRVEAALARARRRDDYEFAVLAVDLDRFQVVNDSFGHRVGDLLIQAVAARLQAMMRPADTVARLGGDRFALLLDEVRDAKAAVAVARRVVEELAVPFEIEGRQIYTGASVGIAVAGRGYREAEAVIRDADTALRRAKRAGRGRYELCDTAIYERARFLMNLEHDLRRAIEEERLSACYQPIVDLARGRRVVGFEALARWHRPGMGPVSPGEFIPVAEEAGLIVPLGWWMLRQACRQVRAWRQQGAEVYIGVNVSARQFALADFTERVAAVLAEEGVEPEWLRLEITESVLMLGGDVVERNLHALREMGFRIYLDDFGTGFSSLSYLHRFPVDVIKVDRSFVAPLAGPGGDVGLVRSILALARDLDKDVVAEGVERPAQEEALRGLGCRFAQGYLYAAPLPAAEASAVAVGDGILGPREGE